MLCWQLAYHHTISLTTTYSMLVRLGHVGPLDGDGWGTAYAGHSVEDAGVHDKELGIIIPRSSKVRESSGGIEMSSAGR